MGTSASWLSISTKPKDAALAELDLLDSGAPVQPGQSDFAGATLPDGSYLLVLRGAMHPIVSPSSLEALSAGATLIACTEQDNTNASMACQVRNGKRVWEVVHILDEGPDHLDVKGRAPKALAGLLEAARQARAQHGHDAVMGVPDALARKAAGYPAGAAPAPAFTRLEPVPGEPFGSPTCLWRRILQTEQAERFEQEQPDLLAALAPRVARALAPLGFAPVQRPGVRHQLARTVGELTQFVRPVAGAHGRLNALLEARHALADRIVDEYTPTMNWPGDPPYALLLSRLEGRGDRPYAVHNAADLDAFGALLEARLPHWAAQLADLRALDRASQKSYADQPLVNMLLKRRYHLLAGAWLTGNPDLPALVEACAPSEERRAQCEGLLALLREKCQPLP